MRILGIDPGSTVTGYGVVDLAASGAELVGCGVVRAPARRPFPERLKAIYDGVEGLISTYKPEQVAVEDLFYAENVKSALRMGHARGVVLLAVAQHALPVSEYSPREIKMAVAGNGGASKEQVQRMIKALLGLRQTPARTDTSDALAVALCHIHRLTGAAVQTRSRR